MELVAGQRLGNLLIERELGTGAFGSVYLARDEVIDRVVALKVMRRIHGEAGESERARVLNEARLIGNLKSPHIVTLHRVESLPESAGWLFEMEYVEGGSLETVLDDSKLSLTRTEEILRGVLAGLAAAHEGGVIHGDVKPANVLLDTDGSVKLADFGTARLVGDPAAIAAKAGGAGTPLYMAPEQFMGGRPDPTADLWGVGVVLCRMLTGHFPFPADNLHDLFRAVLNEEPAPLDDSVPPRLARVVLHCLAKDPGDRPSSAEELIRLLDEPAAAEIAPRTGAPEPMLHGRRDELDRLLGLVAGVGEGRGGAALVTGDAGIGKAALLRATGVEAVRNGCRWIQVLVTPEEGLLRPLLAAAGRAASAPGGGDIGKLLTEYRPDAVETLPQQLWLVEQLLAGIAALGPTGVVFEDVHNADEGEGKLLVGLARRVSELGLFLALAGPTVCRGTPSDPLAALGAVPGIHRFEIGPLPPEEISRMIDENRGDTPIAPQTSAEIARRSEGNPLLALELLRHLEDTTSPGAVGGALSRPAGWTREEVPRRFQDLAARRLAKLSPEEREIIDFAAVDGQSFDGAALAAATGRPLLTVLRTLQGLHRAGGLIVPRETGFRFGHGLFRQVVYDEIAPEYRRAIHLSLAEHLEQLAAETEVDPARIGTHFERAGHVDRARPHLLAAALAAAKRQEQRRTIDLAARAGIVPGKVDPEVASAHPDLVLKVASMYSDVGRHDDAEKIYEAVHAFARGAGDDQLGLRAMVLHSRFRLFTGGRDAVDSDELRRAAEVLTHPRERGQACLMLGVIARTEGRLEEATEHLHTADRLLAEGAGDVDLAAVREILASVALRAGRVGEAESLYAEAAELNRELGRRTNAAVNDINRLLSAFGRGEFEGIEETMERLVRTLLLEGARDLASHANVLLSSFRFAAGDLAGATVAAEEAIAALRTTGYLPGLVPALLQVADCRATAGDLGGADHALSEAETAAEKAGNLEARILVHADRALLRSYAEDPDGAREAAERALALARTTEEARAHQGLGLALALAALFGLPTDVAADCLALLDGGASPGEVRLARHALMGAIAYSTPTAPSDDLRTAAAALRERSRGAGHALHLIVAGWLEAEATARERGADASREALKEPLAAARSFGHVWLQAGLTRGRKRP